MRLQFKPLVIGALLGLCLAANAAPYEFEGIERVAAPSDAAAPLADPAETAAYDAPAAVQAALDRVNHYRRIAGLQPVVLDAKLSKGCQAHARYMVLNRNHPSVRGMGAHSEQPGLPGYSPEGRAAAGCSVIVHRRSLVQGVDTWMATLYHRIPILRPNLRRIGLGYESPVAVMDTISGLIGDDSRSVGFPGTDQKNVPTVFPNELPDPIPAGSPRPAGYPITLQFAHSGPEVGQVKAELRDSAGRTVPFHLSDPQRPACDFPQQNTVCIIPVRQLAPSTTYQVSISGQVNGRTFSKSWAFTTHGAGARAAEAAPSQRLVTGPVVPVTRAVPVQR